MRVPTSTYRIQLNADFPLARLPELIDYFQELGVGNLYFSPIFEARPHSPHGYDVTHPGRINPEIGDAETMQQVSRQLHEAGIGILIDTVPNHMAATEDNPWWRDVLIHGPASLAAHFFDIDWSDGCLVLPVLGQPLEAALAANEISITRDDGSLRITYFGHAYPVDPATYGLILRRVEQIDASLLEAAGRMPPRLPMPASEKERRRQQALLIEHDLGAWAAKPHHARSLDARLASLTTDELRIFLAAQAYLLEYWRTGVGRINYRRFFDVADLAAVRVEDADVFATTHALTLDLLRSGQVDGVRVDHVDGLRDPAAYLRELRAAVGNAFVVVEKILAPKEELADNWPVEGTTGYDFLGMLAGLYCDPDGTARIQEAYQQRTGLPSFAELVYEKKRLVIDTLFAAELDSLSAALSAIATQGGIAVDRESAAACISEVTAVLNVYRTYIADDVSVYDRCVVKHAVNAARHRLPQLPEALFTLLRNVLLNEELPAESAEARVRFVANWQQFTGPVMAKGSEDTALYTDHGVITLSEVGAHPGVAVASVSELHDFLSRRAQRWPFTINASSTHDTKRSEDVRARVQVLTEMADDWHAALERWSTLAEKHRRTVDGRSCPDGNEEILLFQTLLGVWPLDAESEASLPDRLRAFVRKALREGKLHSSWLDPQEAYEHAVADFVTDLMRDHEFLAEFRQLHEKVAWFGALNSLSQLVLKLTAPGIPDVYQGNESFTFRLVDPDNRAAVDFAGLGEGLSALPAEIAPRDAAELLRTWQDGRIKLHVTRSGLQLRKRLPHVFANGDYLPVGARGRFASNTIAFARRIADEWVLTATGRYYSNLGPRPMGHAWSGTALELPDGAPQAWRNLLTNEVTNGSALEAVFATLPFAVLVRA